MARVRPASATSEAIETIEAEVLLKVWDVLHPRAVGEASAASGGGAQRAKRAYRRRPRSSCRRQRMRVQNMCLLSLE